MTLLGGLIAAGPSAETVCRPSVSLGLRTFHNFRSRFRKCQRCEHSYYLSVPHTGRATISFPQSRARGLSDIQLVLLGAACTSLDRAQPCRRFALIPA